MPEHWLGIHWNRQQKGCRERGAEAGEMMGQWGRVCVGLGSQDMLTAQHKHSGAFGIRVAQHLI